MEALLIIDVQNDFLPDGALAVPDGDQVIPIINQLQKRFDLIIATQDWHPANHGSFAANHEGKKPGDMVLLSGVSQMLWPVHCVQDSPGADFHPSLDREKWSRVFRKGTNPLVDSYSGFFDNNRMEDTGLSSYLRQNGIDTVYVTGLATDYCVKFTVLDALNEGFTTLLVGDATKGVNIATDDSDQAIREMAKAGARIVSSDSII